MGVFLNGGFSQNTPIVDHFFVGKPHGCWGLPHPPFWETPHISSTTGWLAHPRCNELDCETDRSVDPPGAMGTGWGNPTKRRDFVSGWCLISEGPGVGGWRDFHKLLQRCVIDWKIMDVACKEYGKNLEPFETDNFTANYRWFSGRKIEIIHNESPFGWNMWLST